MKNTSISKSQQEIEYYQQQLISARKSLKNYQEYVNEEMQRFQMKLQSQQAILKRLEQELAAAEASKAQTAKRNSQQVEVAA